MIRPQAPAMQLAAELEAIGPVEIEAIRSRTWRGRTLTGDRIELSLLAGSWLADKIVGLIDLHCIRLPGHTVASMSAARVGPVGDRIRVRVEAVTAGFPEHRRFSAASTNLPSEERTAVNG